MESKHDVAELARQYIEWDPNPETRAHIQQLLNSNDASLAGLVTKRMQFGTAGLRARMGVGYCCMNDLTIIQTTQGLVRYAQAQIPNCAEMGLALGYDGRHNSKRFAELTASVFLSQGITVHLFNRLAATPMIPFTVKELGCAVGIVITASHNPKDDNGYKVYWSNGAQIIPPHDSGIAASIEANLQPWQSYPFDASHPLLRDPTDEMTQRYFTKAASQYCFHKDENPQSVCRVCFTAMHGVGLYWTSLAFEHFNLPPFTQVAEQVQPDPDFPTVKFPNPEEGKGALSLAIQTANRENCSVILANDPDADRLAVAEKDPSTGEWLIFNGNQIAALLADWVWTNYKKAHPQGDYSRCCMVASTVSSKFLQSMAEQEGFVFADTLTGFKWMGNKAIEMEREGYTFLFAYEVEIGFLVGNMSYDKDGVRTAAIFAEMANQHYLRGVTLAQHLQSLYRKYGFFEMNTSYFFCHEPATMARVFARLRTAGPDGSYFRTCGDATIAHVRDVTLGYDSRFEGNQSVLPRTPDSQMLTFYFQDGTVATLRNSGTEPKIKYYVEAKDRESPEAARQRVDHMTQLLISEFMQPEQNGLIAPKR